MSETNVLKAEVRKVVGTRFTRREREAGLMPAVIYGKGSEGVAVSVSAHDVFMELQHHKRVLTLDLEGKQATYMIKEVQYDHLCDKVIHMDLNEVDPSERVKVSVELLLKGIPVGQTAGGVLKQVTTMIDIEASVIAIPGQIAHVIADMQLNDVLKAKDLILPSGVTLIADGDIVVATLKIVEDSDEPELADADAAPEVIGGAPEDGDTTE